MMHDRRSVWRRCAAAAGGAAAGLASAIPVASWVFDLAGERFGPSLAETGPELAEEPLAAPFVSVLELLATQLTGALFALPVLVVGSVVGMAVGLRLVRAGLILATVGLAVSVAAALLVLLVMVGVGPPSVPAALVSVALAALAARALIEGVAPDRAERRGVQRKSAAGAGASDLLGSRESRENGGGR